MHVLVGVVDEQVQPKRKRFPGIHAACGKDPLDMVHIVVNELMCAIRGPNCPGMEPRRFFTERVRLPRVPITSIPEIQNALEDSSEHHVHALPGVIYAVQVDDFDDQFLEQIRFAFEQMKAPIGPIVEFHVKSYKILLGNSKCDHLFAEPYLLQPIFHKGSPRGGVVHSGCLEVVGGGVLAFP